MIKSRRRSLSASRTLDSTVNFVGRIGASLRISSRKRAKEKQKIEQAVSLHGGNDSESWLRSGAHYAKIGIERRRSTCSAIFLGTNNKNTPKLYFADEDCDETEENENEGSKRSSILEVHNQKRYQLRSNSVVSPRDCRVAVYNDKHLRSGFRMSKSNADFCSEIHNNSVGFADEDESYPSEYIDDDGCVDEEDDSELLSLALVPLSYNNAPLPFRSFKSHSTVSSPLTVASGMNGDGSCGGSVLTSTRSCPSTPQTPRRRYMREGATQLTSLTTLCTHHRYLFLFNDLLLVSKQKGENSYKLKEKVSLDRLWISSNNCAYSFLIGWPIHNYTAHFSSETERNEWFNKLNECIQRRITNRPKTTTISVAIRIEGRHQLIRHEVENGVRANQIVQELIETLDLPTLDRNLFHYELCFEFGNFNNGNNTHHIINSNSTNCITNSTNNNNNSIGLINHSVSNNFYNFSNYTSSYSGGGSTQLTALNGVENIYAILMDHVINRIGVSLSDSQLAHLDTCPLVNCRLVLRQASNNVSNTSSRSNAALNIVNQFRKVLSRTDSSSKRLFGRQLEGSMPPQPVLTMIDHLTLHGAHVEGIFRKSPKQATVRVLKAQLDHGQVPNFHQFNVYVTASLLKEYLRSIPGQLLISANYHLWMEITEEPDAEKKLKICRQLLRLLPPSHTVLLRSILRLLRRIASAESTSKMSVNSLSVCIAPSLLENPNLVDSARRVPELAAYLIRNANELFDNFVDGPLLVPSNTSSLSSGSVSAASTTGSDEGCVAEPLQLHQSTDSGLSDDATAGKSTAPASFHSLSSASSAISNCDDLRAESVSPDSALFEIPTSECSGDDERYGYQANGLKFKQKLCMDNGVQIEEIDCSISPDQLTLKQQICQMEAEADDDRTPVLSRENSNVKTQFPNRYQWRSHLSTTTVTTITPVIGAPGADTGTEIGLQSPDLSNAGASVRVLRLKQGSASPCASPNLSIASSIGERFRRSIPNTIGASTKANVVSSVDDLRVSDFIISDSMSAAAATKYNNSNSNVKIGAAGPDIENLYSQVVSLSERPSRKTSIVSMTDSESKRVANTRKISTASIESSTSQTGASNLRRTALVTKNETLGLETNGIRKVPIIAANYIEKTSLLRKSANATINKASTAPYHLQLRNNGNDSTNAQTSDYQTKFSAGKVQQYQRQRQPTQASVSLQESTTKNISSTGNELKSKGVVRRPSTNNNSNNNGANAWSNSSAYGAGFAHNNSTNNTSSNKITRRQSDRRANTIVAASSTTSAASGIVSRNSLAQQRQQNGIHSDLPPLSTTFRQMGGVVRQPGQRPWRPPKRTAEEIVLDKSLEVNWSVSSIRTVFQKHKDDKPAAIDTVYAKFNPPTTTTTKSTPTKTATTISDNLQSKQPPTQMAGA